MDHPVSGSAARPSPSALLCEGLPTGAALESHRILGPYSMRFEALRLLRVRQATTRAVIQTITESQENVDLAFTMSQPFYARAEATRGGP